MLYRRSECIMMSQDSNVICKHYFKITMIGDSTVGKTTYIDRYIREVFMPDYRATVGGIIYQNIIFFLRILMFKIDYKNEMAFCLEYVQAACNIYFLMSY